MIGEARYVLSLLGNMAFVLLMGVLGLLGVLVVGLGTGALWFEVWKLFQ